MSATATRARGATARTLPAKRVRWADELFAWALRLCVGVAMLFLAALLVYVVVRGWPRLDGDLVTAYTSVIRPETAGARAAIIGTVWVIGFVALFCLPTGVLAAIYLEEYADRERWWNRLLELNIANLAAVPSIVFGILGLGFVARMLGLGFTVITASIVLSLLVLPIVIIAAREAIRAVPGSIREASYGLGATKWQTIWRQVLPAAVPGIATGSILALSRAAGEAAPLLLLGGLSFISFDPDGLFSRYTVLPIQIFGWISQSREEFQTLASAGIVVMLIVILAMNSTAIFIRNRYQNRR
ncbi:phosphate ABC transporter permease PstA [Allonocardiopsis opalescens]|uniref:Phosphate transport system permease protein PstA n=1 Tax=Allonocardiopsis opalescens TaxID=1144618 RepID=A0A2T0Q540_9ACTN|nr:phosphate ABC transporter permease PstA [Allonocardiopsis opalescens]PRX98937.1 phosphate ABC transporter membrane protein 2 (PhoT family) [Allonocardiopsis opalescens]